MLIPINPIKYFKSPEINKLIINIIEAKSKILLYILYLPEIEAMHSMAIINIEYPIKASTSLEAG